MSQTLVEIKRNQHITKTKQSDNYEDQSLGRNRYFRRGHSKVDKSVQHLNRLDANKLFTQGILDINLDVIGETDTYVVRISFGKFLRELHNEVMQDEGNFTLPVVTKALVKSFNSDDVLVRCQCPDFVYRQSYWLSMNKGIAGEMETRPSNITNPGDTKGSGCKHIQVVLSNTGWLQRVSRVIFNYVNYMKEHYQGLYAEKIYPAIYEKDYDDLYQQDLDLGLDKTDIDNPDETSDTLDTANKWAREKGRFKPGNEYRFRKQEKEDPNQMTLNFDEPEKQFDIDSLY